MSRFVSILLFSSFVFFCFNAQSQTTSDDLKKIRLNGLYDGAFADVLERISQEHAVKFSYNRVLLEKRNVQDFPDNLPLNQFLDYWCGLFDLRYYVSDGVIHIVGKESHKKRSNTIGHLELTVEATFTLSGKVTDKRTSKPLPYASIAIKGTRQVTRTNANGLFVLKGIRSDVVRLVVTRQGYDSETMRVSLSSDRNFLTIEMTDYSRQLRALMEKVHSRK